MRRMGKMAMGELPKGWAKATLNEIAEINPRHSNDIKSDLQVTFVPMPAVSETRSTFQFAEERNFGDIRKGYTHFAEGDVLFAKITPCMENGKASVATGLKNGIGCGSTELHVLRPLAGIQPLFIYNFLHQESFRKEAARNFTGTAGQLRVPVSFMKDAKIPLPPLPEQHRIVAKLEKILHRVDVCKERLDKIPAILKRFRQSVLAAACSGKLTEDWRKDDAEDGEGLPARWQALELGKLCDGFQYGTSTKSASSGTVPVLRMGNIQNGQIDWTDLVYTSDAKEIAKYNLQPGDILFNRTNSPELVGKTGIYRGERRAIFAGYLIRIKNNPSLNSEYLNFCLNASYAKEWCLQVKTDGVSQSNINAQKLSEFIIPLPPLPEQQEIVRRVEALFKKADAIEARYRKAKAFVDKLTQSILAKAFRGELVSQDPNDEPASVLLERIRAEKEKAQKKVVSIRGRAKKYKPFIPSDLPMAAEEKADYKA